MHLDLRKCVESAIDLVKDRLVAGAADAAVTALEFGGGDVLGQPVGGRKEGIEIKAVRQPRLTSLD